MTLDAMHWVWNYSQSKGNTRIALLYVADQVRTSACEVRVGHRELVEALNAGSKGTAETALKKAVELGELEVVEESSGRRPALYKLPKAVGYVRPTSPSAPDSRAQDSTSAPKSGAQPADQGPRSAPKNGAREKVCAPDFDSCAPKNGAPPHTHKEQAGTRAGQPDGFQICQPLIKAMTDAGITVSWQMQAADWNEIAAIVQRAGVEAMVAFALDTRASARQPIRYATFFLRGGWKGLPPRSDRPRDSPPKAPRPMPPHCGHLHCDPDTRLRDVIRNGLPEVALCPECHPETQGARQ